MSSMTTLQGPTTGNVEYEAENDSQEMEQMQTHFRFPEEFRIPEVNSQIRCDLQDTGLGLGF